MLLILFVFKMNKSRNATYSKLSTWIWPTDICCSMKNGNFFKLKLICCRHRLFHRLKKKHSSSVIVWYNYVRSTMRLIKVIIIEKYMKNLWWQIFSIISKATEKLRIESGHVFECFLSNLIVYGFFLFRFLNVLIIA